MTIITFLNADGSSREVQATDGMSIMQVAKAAGVDGIIAECGGELVCATCHVYMKFDALADGIDPPSAVEEEMLDFTSEPRRPASRLSCQIKVTGNLERLVVEIPRTQI